MAAKAALFCCKRLRRKALSLANELDGGVAGPWMKATVTSASRSDVV
jgi:hypothetical protein